MTDDIPIYMLNGNKILLLREQVPTITNYILSIFTNNLLFLFLGFLLLTFATPLIIYNYLNSFELGRESLINFISNFQEGIEENIVILILFYIMIPLFAFYYLFMVNFIVFRTVGIIIGICWIVVLIIKIIFGRLYFNTYKIKKNKNNFARFLTALRIIIVYPLIFLILFFIFSILQVLTSKIIINIESVAGFISEMIKIANISALLSLSFIFFLHGVAEAKYLPRRRKKITQQNSFQFHLPKLNILSKEIAPEKIKVIEKEIYE
ncbi:MAG: hypothetical protein ACTSRZ_13010 [Promethearchaeota archaeon]